MHLTASLVQWPGTGQPAAAQRVRFQPQTEQLLVCFTNYFGFGMMCMPVNEPTFQEKIPLCFFIFLLGSGPLLLFFIIMFFPQKVFSTVVRFTKTF